MLPLLFAVAITIPQTGRVVLPAGTTPVAEEIRVPDGAHDLVIAAHPRGTTLRAAPGFKGRAIIVCERARNIQMIGFAIDGARQSTPARVGLPPSDVPFVRFYRNNGILVEQSSGVVVNGVRFANVWAFPLLVSHSDHVQIAGVSVSN